MGLSARPHFLQKRKLTCDRNSKTMMEEINTQQHRKDAKNGTKACLKKKKKEEAGLKVFQQI